MSNPLDHNKDKPLFSRHEHALEKAYEVCPECSSELMIKHGKAGAFFSCANYPNCQYTRSVVEHERVADTVLPGSSCPLCGYELAVKEGRYGMFIGCTNYPQCHHIEDEQQHAQVGVACPSCASKGRVGQLKEKTNRYGKIFYSCDQYPKCKYVLNHQPIEQLCPSCKWPVLIKRTMASGEVLSCPQKQCDYKQKTL
ncbi:topoisomerase DNA-binding C4 zinc finger domain-containing protein [Colwellia sp. KU-HH00111]|uniref:DNA topoisomerase family protein n=1 Tax=Colwellia sp. KU-HH00111 TaxID=3127652 RepID=UPI0031053E28